MSELDQLARRHVELSRRYFLRRAGLGAAGLSALLGSSGIRIRSAFGDERDDALAAVVRDLEYLTLPEDFQTVERGKPLPYTLPEDELRAIGMTRETWQLEVVPDAETEAKVDNPLTKELGTALDWDGLMKLAERKAVKFLKVMTCNNISNPLGMGLWEGVPLREVLWLAEPVSDIRRVYYYGHHNEIPEQRFQSSLPIGRVFEDPPGTHPVILCYKLNGDWITGKRGGPVRMIVPEAYGFKNVKWLQRIVLTNLFHANDTYALKNNDIDSPMKTFARFLAPPVRVKSGDPLPLAGVAQVGMSGLSKVQYWIRARDDEPLADDDLYFRDGDWRDAAVLDAPTEWGGGLPSDGLPAPVEWFDGDGRPRRWPMRYTIAHWAALVRDTLAPGRYDLRCRSVDAHGRAQPMPRPFLKSGRNEIQRVPLVVEA